MLDLFAETEEGSQRLPLTTTHTVALSVRQIPTGAGTADQRWGFGTKTLLSRSS